jgi:hypothetical protein
MQNASNACFDIATWWCTPAIIVSPLYCLGSCCLKPYNIAPCCFQYFQVLRMHSTIGQEREKINYDQSQQQEEAKKQQQQEEEDARTRDC